MGNLFFLKRINTSTMTGKTDEEEYQMYEEVFREKISGEALLFVYYLDHESFEKAEEILEKSALETAEAIYLK